jgi:TonB family protein
MIAITAEIDKDLVRWDRRKWIFIVSGIFVMQLALILLGSRKTIANRVIRTADTEIQLSWVPPDEQLAEWLHIQDPLLFAAPSWNGLSGSAWMRKDPWIVPQNDELSRPVFLLADEIPKPALIAEENVVARPNVLLPPNTPSEPVTKRRLDQPHSRLLMEGFSGWTLAREPVLPVQYFNDVVGKSVVETIVESDGTVLSATILDGSGSKKADSDALAFARNARFLPSGNQPATAAPARTIGKLIFDWYALDFSQTNNVQR